MNFNKTILPNGARLITVPMSESPTVTALFLVEAGSEYESKKESGLSHFLEHFVFKGTARRPKTSDISRELDSLGARYNAFTCQEYTGYFAKADKSKGDKILDILSDLYLHPLLPESELSKEKGVIIQEINMYEDEPSRHVQDVFLELLYGDQPAGWNIAGTKESVAAFNREAVAGYYRRHYTAEATTLVLAGNVQESALAEAEKILAKLPRVKKPAKPLVLENQKALALKIKPKNTDQTHLVLGVRAFNSFSPKAPVLKVLSVILGGGMSSRLFQKLRDELGLCYYVGASPDLSSDHGFFQVASGVDNAKLLPAIRAIMEELGRLRAKTAPAEELRKAKDFLIGNLYLSLESSDELAQFYGGQEILRKPLKTPQAIAAEIEAVTADEVKTLAEEIFKPEGLNLALIGPATDENLLIPLLRF